MPESEWTYLGDGVYAKYDGFGIMLHANDHKDPTDRVYLEPFVFNALVEHYELMSERQKKKNDAYAAKYSSRDQGIKEKHTENYKKGEKEDAT